MCNYVRLCYMGVSCEEIIQPQISACIYLNIAVFVNTCLFVHFETSYIMPKINNNAMIEPKTTIIYLFPCNENSHVIESGLYFNMDDALPRVVIS